MQARACSFERNDVSLSERFSCLCPPTDAPLCSILQSIHYHAHLWSCHAPSNACTLSSNALTLSDNSCKMTKDTSCITCATVAGSTMPTCNGSVMQCLIPLHGIIHVGTSPCCNAPQWTAWICFSWCNVTASHGVSMMATYSHHLIIAQCTGASGLLKYGTIALSLQLTVSEAFLVERCRHRFVRHGGLNFNCCFIHHTTIVQAYWDKSTVLCAKKEASLFKVDTGKPPWWADCFRGISLPLQVPGTCTLWASAMIQNKLS